MRYECTALGPRGTALYAVPVLTAFSLPFSLDAVSQEEERRRKEEQDLARMADEERKREEIIRKVRWKGW